MPTTSLSGWSFINAGPLTTTYTAPASCYTEAINVQLGLVATDGDTNATTLVPYIGLCNNNAIYTATTENCIPSGAKINSQYSSIDISNPTAFFTADYYSPGLYCPSNYVTVGTASNNAGTITSSGAAFVPTTTYSQRFPIFNPVPNILLSALNVGEAAVLCCPQSYQVNLFGACYSALPSRPIPSEACYREVPDEDLITITSSVSLFGTSVTAGFLELVNSVPITQVVTSTIETTDATYSIITLAPMITLVHNAAQAPREVGPSSTSSTSSSASSRSASAGRIYNNNRNKLILLLSCWVIGVTTRLRF